MFLACFCACCLIVVAACCCLCLICPAEDEYTCFRESIVDLQRLRLLKSNKVVDDIQAAVAKDANVRINEGRRRVRYADKICRSLSAAVASWPDNGPTRRQLERTMMARQAVGVINEQNEAAGVDEAANATGHISGNASDATPDASVDVRADTKLDSTADASADDVSTNASSVAECTSADSNAGLITRGVRHRVMETDSHTHTHAVGYHLTHDEKLQRFLIFLHALRAND